MSVSKNLEWICRRCEKTQKGLEIEHSTELLKTCDYCGTENWCFLITSSRQTNTTDELVFDEIAPVEMAPEAQPELSVEEMKAEAEKIIEKSNIPEEVKKDIVIEIVKEEPLETEPEPSSNVLSGDIDIGPLEDKIAAKDAAIAELEAKLEALKK